MSAPQINLNSSPTDPTLKDLLDAWKKDIMLSLSCHHVGTIQSYDAEEQTATATINYKKTYFRLNASTGLYDPTLVDYPLLVDCPAIVLGGGGAALTFPITKGDECVVLFNDRDIGNWFQGSATSGNATSRLHSFSDGLVLVGVRSIANVLTAYDTVRAVLRNGQAMVGVGTTLVKIANGTTSLNAQLANLVTAIKTLSIDVAGIGPAQGVVDATSIATLTNVATGIAGLLE